jgi:hypothetical protein
MSAFSKRTIAALPLASLRKRLPARSASLGEEHGDDSSSSSRQQQQQDVTMYLGHKDRALGKHNTFSPVSPPPNHQPVEKDLVTHAPLADQRTVLCVVHTTVLTPRCFRLSTDAYLHCIW